MTVYMYMCDEYGTYVMSKTIVLLVKILIRCVIVHATLVLNIVIAYFDP